MADFSPVKNVLRPSLAVAACLLPLIGCAGESPPEEGEAPTSVPGAESSPAPVDTVIVEFGSEQDIEAFFDEIGYGPDHWAAGVREIPRLYVTAVGDRWRQRANDDLTVQSKKRIFFRAMGPLALRSNELIRAERDRLLGLPATEALSDEERRWLAELAEDYGLEVPDVDMDAGDGADGEPWGALRTELQNRVDEVPVSLVLAQAANESGWGTSRFATEGNALFGQWTFGGSGMLPAEQRASLGDYRVAAFESPLLSVVAYMRNLNTHRSYARLRELRAEARAADETPRGLDLAGGLDRYSERGQEYVDEIRSMIEFNQLQDTDLTYLAPGPVYLVIPADGTG
ncbi:MAG: glucosaminidase domain-containing protein [Gemmatimonadota bacterium]